MKKNVKKDPASYKPGSLVVNNIIVRAVNRSQTDVGDLKDAHRSAEQIEHPQTIRLFDMYDDIELDGHLTGITQKRIEAVLNKQLKYVDKEGKKVEEMDTTINSLVFRDIISILIKRKFPGRKGMEFIPGEKLAFEEIPIKHIKPHIKKITKEQSGEEGWDYENNPNLWVFAKTNDFGLYLKCGYYALLKRGVVADWAQYIERYGIAPMVAKYDAYDIKTKAELQGVFDQAGSALALLIPKQADFEIKPEGTANNSNGDLQDKFRKACNDEMSVIVLTNTETTTSSSSSGYAQSKEHGKQQLEVTKSDMKEVELLLSTDHFYNILKMYALPVVEGGQFMFEKEFDLAELLNRTTVDTFVSQKVPIGDDYYYDTYGIPKPADYATLKAKMEKDKQMEQQSKFAPPGAPGGKPKDKKKPKPLSAEQELAWWERLRNFFAHAHKD